MSMKKFLSISRKADGENNKDNTGDLQPVVSASKSNTTVGSQDSIDELQPIFDRSKSNSKNMDNSKSESPSFSFTNDPNLNLNPSISNTQSSQSLLTKESDYMGKSIFSESKRTFSTRQSSHPSGGSGGKESGYRHIDYVQPLQILDIAEESKEDDKNPSESIFDKLHELNEDCFFIMNQYNNSLINLTTAVINMIDCLKRFVTFVDSYDVSTSEPWNFTTYNNVYLRRIMKFYLNFYDNLLRDEVYIKLKLLLVKNFNDFAFALNSSSRHNPQLQHTINKPQNFAVGVNDGKQLPNEELLAKIIEKISRTSISIKEQTGSFIAPITRGISKDLNILCLFFGYPNPTDYHIKLTKSIHDVYDDIHVVVMKDQIELASTKIAGLPQYQPVPSHIQQPMSNPLQKFKLPFRMPTDITKPPISLSLSIENSARISGTMGGFIYPMIDSEKQPHLESYSNSKFAVSCGHVCLDSNDEHIEYPNVSVPSSVLISLYKQALWTQFQKFNRQGDEIAQLEAKVAYGSVLKQVDELFPLKNVKVIDPKTKKETYETKNLPVHRFGQIIWGERTLIEVKKFRNNEEIIDKRLSDLAILKVNKNLKCDQNFLGDDIAFNEFDPGLMFDNLYVRAVINLSSNSKELDLNIDEVDSSVSINSNLNGLPVFKYGSTTKFTKGTLNGIKLVYWLDGAIHSSEFVVNSLDNNTAFAAGGDSGSWILAKLEDCPSINESKGLGVVGMLHSYDGEFKQFGLFTPMCEILERLEEVTNIKWGVVGVSEKDCDRNEVICDTSSEEDTNEESNVENLYDSDSDSDSDSDDSDSESAYESGLEDLDGALPPEID